MTKVFGNQSKNKKYNRNKKKCAFWKREKEEDNIVLELVIKWKLAMMIISQRR